MAASQNQKAELISRYRVVMGKIINDFHEVKALGDEIKVLGLLTPESVNMLQPADFFGANSDITLEMFGAAMLAMAQLDALFNEDIRLPLYEVRK